MATTTPTMMRVLAAAVQANVPTLIWGDPGVGKTAKLEAYGAAWGRDVCTISASSRDAVDFMGLPMEADGRVVYSPLGWALRLNSADRGLLVVDEITTAASTFKAFLRIVQERYVGELALASTVSIVALANPPEIAVDGVDLPAPVANRFLHLDWHFDFDQWIGGMGTGFAHENVPDPRTYLGDGSSERRAHVAAMVAGFLHSRPQLVNKVPSDLTAQGRAWPSARSWTNVVDVLSWLREDDDDARDLALKGLVGEGAYTEFVAWLLSADLPNPVDVLDDPSIVDFADRIDRTFAVLSGVSDLALMRGDRETWLKALDVMVAAAEANRADVAVPATTRLVNVREHVAKGLPESVRDAFTDLLVRAGRIADTKEAA